MINWSRVAELRDEIGAEDFGDVVDLFLEEVDEEIANLSGPVAAEGLEARLHFLKGSALNLGFDAFSDLCRDGEQRAAGGEGGAVDLVAICDTYARSKTRFLTELEHRFA
ncbi:MAG: Hpt domain-containing protein [Pseudomonadota bacterium]